MWEVGDTLIIIDSEALNYIHSLTDGEKYVVVDTWYDGSPIIKNDRDISICLYKEDMEYILKL